MKFEIRTDSNFWGDKQTCEFDNWEAAAKFVLDCKLETADLDDDGNELDTTHLMSMDEAMAFARETLVTK